MSNFGQRTRASTGIKDWMPSGDEVPQNPTSIEMLLVGGGGAGSGGNAVYYPSGGASQGGGGGAGGVYSSVSGNPGGGPGGAVAPVTPIAAGVTYAIVIGGSGTASTFSAPTISTITASAGGGGGGVTGPGGGAGGYTGQPSGYGGGSPHYGSSEWHSAGGGGGAGGAGASPASTPSGVGMAGASVINTIRASSPTFPQYYGGGGAAGSIDNYIAGAGVANSQPGTYGRGGTGNYGGPTGPGQPGVCVFRYPDTFPTAPTTTGDPTVITTDGYHIYTFTASGTIAW